MDLRFVRDTDRRESTLSCSTTAVPSWMSKQEQRNAATACRYFRERTDIPRFYQVHLGTRDYGDAQADTRVVPFWSFCAELALP